MLANFLIVHKKTSKIFLGVFFNKNNLKYYLTFLYYYLSLSPENKNLSLCEQSEFSKQSLILLQICPKSYLLFASSSVPFHLYWKILPMDVTGIK